MFQPHVSSEHPGDAGCQSRFMVVTPSISVATAIAQMSQHHMDCVLVESNQQIVGIFTIHDVVRVVAAGVDLNRVPIADVMNSPVTTLTATEAANVFTISERLSQGQHDYLPIVDGQGQVVQVVTASTLVERFKQLSIGSELRKEQALNRVIRVIRNSLDLSVVFSAATAEIGILLQADRVEIVQYLPQRQIWLNLADYRQNPDLPSALGIEIPDINNPIAARLKQFEIVRIDDANTCDDDINRAFAETFPGAWLLVPLEFDASVWGSLSVIRVRQPWQDAEVELVCAVADQLAIAIQQSNLYQQVQRFNAELETQVQERTAELETALAFESLLKRITDKVRDSLDESQILQTVVKELALGLHISYCDAALYDRDRQTSTICYEYLRSEVRPAKGVAINVNDMEDVHNQLLQGQYIQFCLRLPSANSVRSVEHEYTILSCPLIYDQGVFGSLWLFKPQHTYFNDLEIRLVQQVANQCAIALRQSYLYQAAQAQVKELERLHRLKDDFLSTVSHELRTPLSNIKMAIQMLEIALKDLDLPTKIQSFPVARYLQILRDECDRETSLINDLLDLARLDAGTEPLMLTTIDLRVWLPHLAEAFDERIRNQQQTLILDIPAELPMLTTDLSYLERTLVELLHNACKYTPPGETIVISANTHTHSNHSHVVNGRSALPATDSADSLVLSVSNSGVEIPPEERDRIFDKFYRIPNHDPWKYGGTGLGLALAKKQVELLQGKIWVTSEHGWTTLTVKLPQTLSAN